LLYSGEPTKEWSLNEAEKKSEDDHALVVLYSACASGDGRPHTHDGRQENGRAHLVKNHIGRHLCQDVPAANYQCNPWVSVVVSSLHKEDADNSVVLIAF
jgi:thiamine phosphate synthase YjbQ (UPF0047 family)